MLQQLALRLQRQASEGVNLRGNVAAQADRIANMQLELVRPRNAWEFAGVKDVLAIERRSHGSGYFVDALRVRKQRRRTDTLLPPIPLSELRR